jgi:hypothetical protein
MLKDLLKNHLSDIRTCKKYDKPVSIHFNSKSHSINDFRFAGRVIKINKKINFRTSNVVYAVHCKKNVST